jgi:hypothetical protein
MRSTPSAMGCLRWTGRAAEKILDWTVGVRAAAATIRV